MSMTADQAQTISDAAQYTFGILETLDSENTQKAISEMEDNLNASIETVGISRSGRTGRCYD